MSEVAAGLYLFPTLALVGAVLFTLIWWQGRRRLARRGGYETISGYLRSVPETDAQKRDAVDTALKGAALCLLGLLFWPLLLAGLTPLYYGVRKIVLLGLGVGNDSA